MAAQEYQRCYTNAQCMAPPDFLLGLEAYVCMEFFCVTRPLKKLSDKMLSPFEVVTRPGSHSYTLHLPNSMCLVYPVFHVSMLEPHTPNTIPGCIQLPPPPETIDGKEHFEINAIHDSAIICCYCMLLHYLVEWKGYKETGKGLKWVSAEDIQAPDALTDFHALNPDKPGPIDKLVASDYVRFRLSNLLTDAHLVVLTMLIYLLPSLLPIPLALVISK